MTTDTTLTDRHTDDPHTEATPGPDTPGPYTNVYVVDPLTGETLLRDGTGNLGTPGQGFAAKWFAADELPNIDRSIYKVTAMQGLVGLQLISKCKRTYRGAEGYIAIFYDS